MVLHGLEELPDLQIQDAIAQDEWRHALQLIDKREKKLKGGQTIDWLTACKASILLLLPEAAKQRQGRSLLDSLYGKESSVVDVNAAMAVQAFAEQRKDFDPRIDVLWTQVANAHPNDEELHQRWFNVKFRTKDWQGARKAAMAYMKHFPNKREPFFWAILANFTASKNPKGLEQEKSLCSAMAYRMAAKAAEDVPIESNKELKSGRTLRVPGDIAFLLDVYESQRKRDEALAVLESDKTGITSRIGRHSWDLVLRKIQLSEKAGRWLQQFRYCFTLLEDALPINTDALKRGFGEIGSSWSVWVALFKAVVHLQECKVNIKNWYPKMTTIPRHGHREPLSHVAATVCAHFSEDSKGRDGLSARMLHDLDKAILGERAESPSLNLAEACLTYFKLNGKKQYCFNDIQMFMQGLDLMATRKLLEGIKAWCLKEHESLYGQEQTQDLDSQDMMVYDAEYLIMQVNMLKLEYYLVHSKWGEPGNTKDITEIEKFVVRCIRSYVLSIQSHPVDENIGQVTERLPGDDAGLLAAIALIRLHFTGNHCNALLQAVAILQHLVQTSPFNYEALVTLTVLYTKVGAGWLAAECFNRLSIKNIQYPALSWLLCTRISTIHPHTPLIDYRISSEKADTDPVQHLSKALDYHLHLRDTDQEEIFEFLRASQYASLVQALGNSVYNQLGFTKYMLLVERARIERLAGVQQKLDYRLLADQLPFAAIENRDRSPIPHWEAPCATSLETMLLPGIWPSRRWLSEQLLVSQAFDTATKQPALFQRDDVVQNVTASNSSQQSSTPAEGRQVDLARLCSAILVNYEQEGPNTKPKNQIATTVTQTLDDIRAWQENANAIAATIGHGDGRCLWNITQNINAPSWETFHTVYLGLDSCRLIEKTMDVIEAQNRKTRLIDSTIADKLVKQIRTLLDLYRASVHTSVVDLSQSLSEGKIQEELLYTIISRQSDLEDKDPIAHWLRHLFVDEQYVRGIVARLQLAWKEALTNVFYLSRPKSSG